jgi:hypothetical protein
MLPTFSFKRLIAFSCALLFTGVSAVLAQTVDTSGGGVGVAPDWSAAIGYLYSGLVVVITALGTKYGFFSKVNNKWIYSIAVGLVLGVVWITAGFTDFLDLLTKFFPIAGMIYQFLKTVGVIKGVVPKA